MNSRVKKHFLKIKLYACLAVMLVSAFVPLKAFATDTAFYSSNDILFYDPDACDQQSSVQDGPSNGSVVAIGDSLLQNAEGPGNLAKELKTKNNYTSVTIDAQVSRFIYQGGQATPGHPSRSGLQAIDDNKAKISGAGTILVVLGTNYDSNFDQGVADFMTKIRGLNPDAKVYWVNIVNTAVPSSADGANSSVSKYSTKYSYSDIDWHGLVYKNGSADTSLINTDVSTNPPLGYHQSVPKGVNKYVSLILDSVGKYSASQSSTGSGASKNLETILRYFTGKGLSLAAAAGIAGNLKGESGFNPAVIQGGAIAPDNYTPVNSVGFGLAQWTFTSRQAPLVAMAKNEHKNITDLGVQLDYMWKEMTTESTYKVMVKRLNAIKSNAHYGSASAPMAAAIIFHGRTPKIMANPTQEIKDVNPPYGFEGSASTAQQVVDDRGKPAEKIYKDYKSKIPDGTGISGVPTDPTDMYGVPATSCNASSPSPSAAGQYGWDLSGSHAMVAYSQCDSQWNNVQFGSGCSLCVSGCGPTSVSMILATLLGDKSITPAVIAPWYAAHGGYVGGCGGSVWNWSVFEQKYPIMVTDLGLDLSKAKAVLGRGGLVLMSWHGPPFTSGGHIMIIRKYSPDGKIYVANVRSELSGKAWDDSIVTSGYSGGGGASGLWGFEKK